MPFKLKPEKRRVVVQRLIRHITLVVVAISLLMITASAHASVSNIAETSPFTLSQNAVRPQTTFPLTQQAPIGSKGAVLPSSTGDWPTYHRDNLHTGYLPGMTDPAQLSVAWSQTLNAAVYAEPLVVNGHVLVATERNTIYSLNPTTGQIEWKTHIGTPMRRSALPCGDIDPLGITGTPVYDPATGLVFAVAEISPGQHVLVGLDATNGQVRVRRSADLRSMTPLVQQQRPGLALFGGYVYVEYGGLAGDCGNYHGWVIRIKTDGTGPRLFFKVPTGREGGIWAPPGPIIDGTGNLFVSVGNGSAVSGAWDKSDSVLRLSPTLQLQDGFAPSRWPQDNAGDADLGSLAPVLLPGNLVFIAGKAGIAYLLHANNLGGVGGQIQSLTLCHAYGGAAMVGSTLFVPCIEGVQQVQIANNQMTAGWRASGVPGSPVVGGNTVYSMASNGTLHALDINTGQDRATVSVGATTRFATPTLYGEQIFVGTTQGIVAVKVTQ